MESRSSRRALGYGGMLALTSAGLLAQLTCMPNSLLDSQPDAAEPFLVAQDAGGRVLTPEELTALVEELAAREPINVVFINPVQGPAGSPGQPGPAGPAGPAGGGTEGDGDALVGEVRMWAGSPDLTPPGWLPCDGRSVSRAAYPALYSVLGERYSARDAAADDAFALPNLRDRSPMGASGYDAGIGPTTTVEGAARAFGGQSAHILTIEQLPSHTHEITQETAPPAVAGSPAEGPTLALDGPDGGVRRIAVGQPLALTTTAAGEGRPIPTVDPYFAVTFIIYAGEPEPQ